MILVVADTSPIRYLVLIKAISVLPQLFERVILPATVVRELTHPHAPEAVRNWATSLPDWVEVKRATHVALAGVLDAGEAEAIALAEELQAHALLLDEAEGRKEALRRGLSVSGTVGVLEQAAQRGLINLGDAFKHLSQTNYRITPEVLRKALERDAARGLMNDRNRGIKP